MLFKRDGTPLGEAPPYKVLVTTEMLTAGWVAQGCVLPRRFTMICSLGDGTHEVVNPHWEIWEHERVLAIRDQVRENWERTKGLYGV